MTYTGPENRPTWQGGGKGEGEGEVGGTRVEGGGRGEGGVQKTFARKAGTYQLEAGESWRICFQSDPIVYSSPQC